MAMGGVNATSAWRAADMRKLKNRYLVRHCTFVNGGQGQAQVQALEGEEVFAARIDLGFPLVGTAEDGYLHTLCSLVVPAIA